MKISICGHNMVGIGDNFPIHVNDSTSKVLGKYCKNRDVSAKVKISKNKRNGYRSSIVICNAGRRHYLVRGDGNSDSPYGAFNLALERMSTGLRRLKRKISNH